MTMYPVSTSMITTEHIDIDEASILQKFRSHSPKRLIDGFSNAWV